MGITGGDSGNGVGDGVVTDIAKLLREAMCYLQRSDPEFAARLESAAAEVESAEPVGEIVETGGSLAAVRLYSPAFFMVGDKVYRHPPSAVPEGWKIEWFDEGEILVRNRDGTAIVLYREKGPSSYPAIMFYDLCAAMLAAAPQGDSHHE